MSTALAQRVAQVAEITQRFGRSAGFDEALEGAYLRLGAELAVRPDDQEQQALQAALRAYTNVPERFHSLGGTEIIEPFVATHLRLGDSEVRLVSTLTTLGTAIDVTAQEIVMESFFPADEASERFLRSL